MMTLLTDLDWRMMALWIIAGALGGVAIIPYALELQADRIGELPMSIPRMALLALVQGLVLMTVLVTLGTLAARTQGLTLAAPVGRLPLAVVAGIVAALLIVGLERGVFLPLLPDAFREAGAGHTALWKRFIASFYGGFTEEILMRLFLMSAIAFVLSRFWHQPLAVLWTANLVAALVFGVLHLPAVTAIAPLSAIVVVRTVTLNMVGGVIFGALFLSYGFTAAVVAHFTADIMLHVVLASLMQ